MSEYLKEYLKIEDELKHKVRMPEGMMTVAGFALEHGQSFVADKYTYRGKRGETKQCFMNAGRYVLYGDEERYVYIEGWIDVAGVPMLHAWVWDRHNKRILDPTLRPKSVALLRGYFGVPFTADYLRCAILTNGFWGLLDFMSRKTLEPLLRGQAKDWKAELTE